MTSDIDAENSVKRDPVEINILFAAKSIMG